jgi:hypothetical protein
MFLDLTRYTVDGLVDGYTERAVLSAAHLIEFAKAPGRCLSGRLPREGL